MSAIHSRMLPLGTAAPDFSLPDPNGQVHSLSDARDAPATLVMFICNHCPYVKHVRAEIAQLAEHYMQRRVAVFAINSNDFGRYPDDHPDRMKEEIANSGYCFPYLVDTSQSVAKDYDAACTPDFFVFDGEQELVYRGQLDASRPGNSIPVSGDHLRAALDAVLDGNPVSDKQIPSIGCSIKWQAGNEPGRS